MNHRGTRLARLRRECGLTREELADLWGYSVHSIQSMEQGRRPVRQLMLDSLAERAKGNQR